MKTIAINIFAIIVAMNALNCAKAEIPIPEVLTFEWLSNPTVEVGSDLRVDSMPRTYSEFQFTSLATPEGGLFDGSWGYYRIGWDNDFGGFDNGILGSRAMFTPWGAAQDSQFTITNSDQFMFHGAYICQVNRGENDFAFEGGSASSMLTITGFVGNTAVYSTSTQITYGVGAFINFNTDIALDRVVFNTDTGAAISLDNFTYNMASAVPAPSILAVFGLAGLCRKRRERN